jgi:Ca2+-binding RTX toxin-like protein
VVTVASAIDREVVGASTNITVRATSADGSFADTVFTIAVADEFASYMGTPGAELLDYSSSTENVFVSALDGNDWIFGTSFADTVDGGDGADLIYSGTGNDSLTGGLGNDTISGGQGADTLDGGAGFDIVSYDTDVVGVSVNLELQTVTGLSGSEAQGDQISGFEGAIGSYGNDVIIGSGDVNHLVGFDGDDLLDGGDGNDTLEGDQGNDTLLGGNGTDQLDDQGGVAVIDGGADDDAIFIDASSLLLPATDVLGGSGIDSVTISAGPALSLADILGSLSQVERIDFSAPGVSADLSAFNHAAATSLLGASGPGLNLDLVLNGDDLFSVNDPVGDGFSFAQVGNVYTFYNSEVLQDVTTEIAKVSLV